MNPKTICKSKYENTKTKKRRKKKKRCEKTKQKEKLDKSGIQQKAQDFSIRFLSAMTRQCCKFSPFLPCNRYNKQVSFVGSQLQSVRSLQKNLRLKTKKTIFKYDGGINWIPRKSITRYRICILIINPSIHLHICLSGYTELYSVMHVCIYYK